MWFTLVGTPPHGVKTVSLVIIATSLLTNALCCCWILYNMDYISTNLGKCKLTFRENATVVFKNDALIKMLILSAQ